MYAKTRSPRISHRRGAFTLVELMIVITIITILISFLVVGVFNATRTARRTACTVEISNLEKAIADFQMEYGSTPPSFVILYEAGEGSGATENWGSDPTNGEQYRIISRAAIRRIWPRYDFTQNIDLNGNGTTTDYFILNGAECLVFFLGGVDDRVATTTNNYNVNWQPTGFAANPQSPFAPSSYGGSQPAGTPAAVTNRRGPYYETFIGDRFIDTDGDGFPEYLDALPDQTQPLQYFSSYEGTGYRPRGLDQTAGTFDDESSVATFVSHYITANSAASGADPVPTSPSASWYPSKFQIISAGFDFEFGSGGVFDGSFPAAGSETYAAGVRDTTYEKDNITNFWGRELN
ncbi:MAG: prepilin-type N-terminal cleavage/methylation domain-containing protein [Planctomycetaceae bacterium]|nr:prepilin-type N-terminal cleavage/methylation domain-containing protein [Planctomycetaceae bacterium]MCB9950645.1 prepilin-type N-terminal cleavage/methylation domain-containing protein [Planctomycetaceae bacterium]